MKALKWHAISVAGAKYSTRRRRVEARYSTKEGDEGLETSTNMNYPKDLSPYPIKCMLTIYF